MLHLLCVMLALSNFFVCTFTTTTTKKPKKNSLPELSFHIQSLWKHEIERFLCQYIVVLHHIFLHSLEKLCGACTFPKLWLWLMLTHWISCRLWVFLLSVLYFLLSQLLVLLLLVPFFSVPYNAIEFEDGLYSFVLLCQTVELTGLCGFCA